MMLKVLESFIYFRKITYSFPMFLVGDINYLEFQELKRNVKGIPEKGHYGE